MCEIIRVKKKDNFTTIDNELIYNSKLSAKAKGVMVYLLSKPNNWTVIIGDIVKHMTDGRDGVRTAIKELEKAGYIHREQVHNSETGAVEWHSCVQERPHCNIQQGVSENPRGVLENPQKQKESLTSGNPTLINTDPNNIYIYSLFDFWNEQKIVKHRKLTKVIKGHIKAKLKDYTVDEIKAAITNYKTVLQEDQYFWSYRWTLPDFLTRGFEKFLTENKPLDNFKKNKEGDSEPIKPPVNSLEANYEKAMRGEY